MPRTHEPTRFADPRPIGFPVILATALALAGTAPLAGATDPVETRSGYARVQILAFNDYHGHLQSSTSGTVKELPAGGGEYLSAKLKELRAGRKNTITVAPGDLIGGSPFASGLFHDEPSVESLNAMGLDLAGVGNHEFDEGVDELLRMQYGGCHPVDGCYFPDKPYAGANFQWLSANLVDDTGMSPLPPYRIETFGGVKVAFIGMTLKGTDVLVAAEGIRGYRFLDEVETANALVPDLRRQGVRAIVLLLHEGGTPSNIALNGCDGLTGPVVDINARLHPEIDAILTGHTHLPYVCRLPDPNGNLRPVTSAYSYGRVVTEMVLFLDRQSGDVRRGLTRVWNHPVYQDELLPDPAVTAVIDKWQPLVDGAADLAVGQIAADILRGGVEGSDRGVESPAGNLVADAQRWATSQAGAEVAFMNPGGLRTDLLFAQSNGEGDGVLTFGEAFDFQPFGNSLLTFPMTGAQILDVLEEQCQPVGSSRPFLHLGVSAGFSYDLDRTIEDVGGIATCTAVSVSNVMLDGEALDPAETYLVTVNSFLADGGDNFSTFAETDPGLRVDGGNDLDALINYIDTFGPVDPPGVDRVNESF